MERERGRKLDGSPLFLVWRSGGEEETGRRDGFAGFAGFAGIAGIFATDSRRIRWIRGIRWNIRGNRHQTPPDATRRDGFAGIVKYTTRRDGIAGIAGFAGIRGDSRGYSRGYSRDSLE